jgi:hypothetical protein
MKSWLPKVEFRLYPLAVIGVTGIWLIAHPNTSQNKGGVGHRDVLPAPTRQGLSPTGVDVATHLSNTDLATQAELIVIGECIGVTTVWIDRNLYTLATINVREVLKGYQTVQVTVALPGGVDANRRIPVAMTYPGAAQIAPNEEVFLFLVGANEEVAGSYAIVGHAQGKLSIVPDAHGTPMVTRALTGLKLQSENGFVPGERTMVPLADLKQEIASHLQSQ